MRPLYRLEFVVKRYGSATALEIPFLAVREGVPCVLAGPNGSGKSTLLSLLAFLEPPSSGTIHYCGGRVDGRSAPLAGLRKEVTLLHQSPYLFDGSVSDNVAFGLHVRGIRGDAQRRRVGEALEAVGLSGFAGRKARALSGGEAQRVALARALALSPRVLLLDEPYSNVDAGTAAALSALVARLPAVGTTVVLATHDPVNALAGADVIRLEGGRPVFVSAPGGARPAKAVGEIRRARA